MELMTSAEEHDATHTYTKVNFNHNLLKIWNE